MLTTEIVLLSLAVIVVAFLYSSVGHAGASGYIATMALFGIAAATIRPTALILNIMVASIGAYQFWRAGHFSWQLFWPFALLSIPLAFVGGYISLPTHLLKILIGLTLLYSAVRFFINPKEQEDIRPPARAAALTAGGALGLLSGLTGTGGGIFLTPLMIFMKWAKTKSVAAISVVFILVNSISGLLGMIISTKSVPSLALWLLPAALIGGTAGSYLGSNRFSPAIIKRLLSVVLLMAAYKLIFQ